MTRFPDITDEDAAFYAGWQPETAITGKDEPESASVAARIMAERGQCWANARKAVLGLEEYATASYVEGVIALNDLGLLIEHGWLCRADGVVIDPTLPAGVAAYFPGLEFPGRAGIQAFLATPQGAGCAATPFFFAFGFGGNLCPSYRAAWQAAWAWQEAMSAAAATPAGSEAVGVLRPDVA